jgi:dTDP-4-amino-4,6-dideoxygalactose transaminase
MRHIEKRIFLSPPHVVSVDERFVLAAIRSGWVAPLGPDSDEFEQELAKSSDRQFAVSLSSGTAALHLGLMALFVGPGDEVVVPTMTFAATAFAVTHAGAIPAFLDVEDASWNLDPEVLETFMSRRLAERRLPAAVITVDVFGRACDYDAILPICEAYGVPVLTDSAEALGALHSGRPAGSVGSASVFSFNGNKIITTSGGGALVTDNAGIARKVRKWASQSREPFPWYEHGEIGYNYRLSNILAALGRSQLARLPEIVEKRRGIRDRYAEELEAFPGVTVMGDPPWGRWNGWITTVLFDGDMYPDAPTRIREALEACNIESRPVWKPMHQQPVFLDCEVVLTGVADRIFADGLCLPSGTGMSETDVDRVLDVMVPVLRQT